MKFDLEKTELKKIKILNATFNIIYKKGIAGLTMRDVSEEAGINQALVHYYFNDKENLLAEFIQALLKRFVYNIEKRYRASDPPHKKLDSYFDASKDFVENQEELFVVLIDIWSFCFRDPALKENYAKVNQRLTEVMQNTLQEGKETDRFQPVDEETLATLFVAFMMGIGMLYHMDNRSFDLCDHFGIVTTNLKQLILHEALPRQKL
jgi:AcrR family transcriptional regulator